MAATVTGGGDGVALRLEAGAQLGPSLDPPREGGVAVTARAGGGVGGYGSAMAATCSSLPRSLRGGRAVAAVAIDGGAPRCGSPPLPRSGWRRLLPSGSSAVAAALPSGFGGRQLLPSGDDCVYGFVLFVNHVASM